MGKKMYYSEEEAASKLTPERLNELIESKELRVYPDGTKKMFKATDVDALCTEEAPEEIPLSSSDDANAPVTPAGEGGLQADTDAGLELSLEDDTKSGLVLSGSPDDTKSGIDLDGDAAKADQEPELELAVEDAGNLGGTDEFAAMPAAGADPNETKDAPPELQLNVEGESGQPMSEAQMQQAKGGAPGEGMSIFDDDELDIETADPMAKTQVAPSLEDQIALEGVGSGSGLLDLTRESDDTSLGAEVLDHIDMDGIPTALANVPGGPEGDMLTPQAVGVGQTPMADAPVVTVEAPDPSAGLFGGLATGVCLLMILMAFVFAAVAQGVLSKIILILNENIVFVLVGGLLVSLVLGVVGFFVGKSALAKHQTEQRMGGVGH